MTLVVACGLKREAGIIDRTNRDVFAVVGGGNAARLLEMLDDQVERFPGIILSAGVAGALDPSLRPGDLVVDGDPQIAAKLAGILPEVRVGRVLGSDTIVATAAEKRRRAQGGALAVDMETHVARAVATRRGLPFGVVRAISDGAEDTLPPAALAGMAPDGGVALGAVLSSLIRQPGQLPALIATARHAGLAFRRLGRAFDALYAADFDRIALNALA